MHRFWLSLLAALITTSGLTAFGSLAARADDPYSSDLPASDQTMADCQCSTDASNDQNFSSVESSTDLTAAPTQNSSTPQWISGAGGDVAEHNSALATDASDPEANNSSPWDIFNELGPSLGFVFTGGKSTVEAASLLPGASEGGVALAESGTLVEGAALVETGTAFAGGGTAAGSGGGLIATIICLGAEPCGLGEAAVGVGAVLVVGGYAAWRAFAPAEDAPYIHPDPKQDPNDPSRRTLPLPDAPPKPDPEEKPDEPVEGQPKPITTEPMLKTDFNPGDPVDPKKKTEQPIHLNPYSPGTEEHERWKREHPQFQPPSPTPRVDPSEPQAAIEPSTSEPTEPGPPAKPAPPAPETDEKKEAATQPPSERSGWPAPRWRSGDPLGALQRDLGTPVRLTSEQENDLVARVKAGDKAAEDELVRAYLPYIMARARRFKGTDLYLEKVNEGALGVMHAAKLYDPSGDAQFSTYATFWIDRPIRSLSSNSGLYLTSSEKTDLAHITREISRLQTALGRPPNSAELSQATGLPPERIAQLGTNWPSAVSLQTPSGENGDRELGDLLAAPDDVSEATIAQRDARAILVTAIQNPPSEKARLSELELKIIELRYGLEDDNPLSVEEVADQLGVSSTKVKSAQNIALRKLRVAIDELPGTGIDPLPVYP